MKLTGLQIFKLLPNKNCKECGFQTCLAFAMKLVAKQVRLDACPYVSDEAKAVLGAASAPPIRLVGIGTGEREVKVGEELVLFRHEKAFFHKTAIAVQVDDRLSGDALGARVREAADFSVERAGERLCIDLIAVKELSGEPERFVAAVARVREMCPLPLILISRNPACMRAGLKAAGGTRPLLWGADRDNADELAALAKEAGAPLVAAPGGSIDDLAQFAAELAGRGVDDIILAPSPAGAADRLAAFTLLRRRALSRAAPGTGYPTILSVPGGGYEGAAAAVGGICKYASIVVLETPSPWHYLPLLTLRQGIYTDPQKPLQVNPGVYRIGEAKPESPLLVTTNFSLTYYMVSSEIEASEIPSWLLVVDAEGQSVLTAWAAGKFNPEVIAKAVVAQGLDTRVPHTRLIIPGYVAMMSGDLEDKLPGWNIMVGPQESADIPVYLKEVWTRLGT
ncbi:MAG: acetyl-CoA decarbonylase/synthase complex subunit gamma [Candidatus Aureabacteria bacterium]|nr:acetyl-CoA decarbonylase/synthase complex subunit gamma [Candidatus Auribacterota bacterium]